MVDAVVQASMRDIASYTAKVSVITDNLSVHLRTTWPTGAFRQSSYSRVLACGLNEARSNHLSQL